MQVQGTEPQPFIAVVLQEFPQLGKLQHRLATQVWLGPQLPQLGDDWPHLFVMTLHEFAEQLGVGHVHVFVDELHVSSFGQFCEQLTLPPHPLGAWLQYPVQGLLMIAQHSPASHTPSFPQLIVPPAPQLTTLPQESFVVPQDRPLHAPTWGTQASGPHPAVQFTGRPQLSVVSPQRLLHQLGSDVQSH